MRIKPPEGFKAVYLPNKEFERLFSQLEDLGFKVEAYLNIDDDEKVISVSLVATKEVQKEEYKIDIGVYYERPDKTVYVEISITDREGRKIAVMNEDVSVKNLISRLQQLESKCVEIIMEDKKQKEQILHEVEEVAKLFKKLGFEIKPTYRPYYVSGFKREGRLTIHIGYDAKTKTYGITVETPKHDLTQEELLSIVKRLSDKST